MEKAENKYLDRLMSLPGLEESKAFFLHAKAKIQAATRRETDLKKENFDAVFMGNQGTGKTMLANLYAKFLASMGVVKAVGAIDGISKFSAYNMSKTSTLSSIHSSCITTGGCVSSLSAPELLQS